MQRHVLVGLVLVACGKDAPPSATEAVATKLVSFDAGQPTVAHAALDAPAGPRLAELPKVDDLPPLNLARGPAGKLARSTKLNNEGYKLHAARDFAAAIAKYRAALVEDPGNLLARYNLASALVSSGDAPKGLAILAQLAVPDCRACTGILIHAKTDDAEWAGQRGVAAFQDITKDAVPDKPELEKLARRVAKLVEGEGRTDGLAPYFHPRLPVALLSNTKRAIASASSPDELKRWGRDAAELKDPYVRVPPEVKCDTKCCKFSGIEEGSDTAYDLQEVCFDGVGDVLFLVRIDFYYYLGAGPG
jgi:hypothetical protein